jgi:hypothetical protein
LQYFHRVEITFIYNVDSHIRFIVFVFLVSDVVAPPPISIEGVTIDMVALLVVAIKGVHWARMSPNLFIKLMGAMHHI